MDKVSQPRKISKNKGTRMKQVILRITTETGLHARPAAMFVEQTNQYSADVSIRNLTTQSKWVDAKSIMNVLTLGIEMNHEIELQVNGEDEQQVLENLKTLVNSGLGDHQMNG